MLAQAAFAFSLVVLLPGKAHAQDLSCPATVAAYYD